jgi:ubiquinol-cytochrome c reductase cytochrome b subunit
MGIAKSQPYGNEFVLPELELTQTQALGLDVYMEKDCAYCHTVLGEGGRREGPDLSNVVRKDRSEEWLIDFIRNPQEVSRWSIMPQYQLSDTELQALADFLLVLDFSKYEAKIFSKQEAQEIVHKKLKNESP